MSMSKIRKKLQDKLRHLLHKENKWVIDFVKALTDLADTYENEGEEVFEIEVVRD